MKKPQLKQYEKKYLATAMVLFEYCAAFEMSMREKTFRGVVVLFWLEFISKLGLRRFWLIVDDTPNFHEKSGVVKIELIGVYWVGSAG